MWGSLLGWDIDSEWTMRVRSRLAERDDYRHGTQCVPTTFKLFNFQIQWPLSLPEAQLSTIIEVWVCTFFTV